jgi:hypothetical protein
MRLTWWRIGEYMADRPVPMDRSSFTGRTALEAKVIHIVDVLADPEYKWSETQKMGGFRAVLGAPLHKGKCRRCDSCRKNYSASIYVEAN